MEFSTRTAVYLVISLLIFAFVLSSVGPMIMGKGFFSSLFTGVLKRGAEVVRGAYEETVSKVFEGIAELI